MLSALIPAEHSYPALQLVPKPVDQRFVQPGPLVLGSTSLKCLRLQQIKTNLSHAYCILLLPEVSDYTTTPILVGGSACSLYGVNVCCDTSASLSS